MVVTGDDFLYGFKSDRSRCNYRLQLYVQIFVTLNSKEPTKKLYWLGVEQHFLPEELTE